MSHKEKHSPYYNLVAVFRDARECALCELESSYLIPTTIVPKKAGKAVGYKL